MEGTVTGEHGVGLIKRDYLKHELGETTVDAMRKVSLLPLLNMVAMLRHRNKAKTELRSTLPT